VKTKEIMIDQEMHDLFMKTSKMALLSNPETGWYFSDISGVTNHEMEIYRNLASLGFIRLAGKTVRISQLGKAYASQHEPDYDWQDWEDQTNVFNDGYNS
jgi:hypothetical protein